jgi:hypothetical protein
MCLLRREDVVRRHSLMERYYKYLLQHLRVISVAITEFGAVMLLLTTMDTVTP